MIDGPTYKSVSDRLGEIYSLPTLALSHLSIMNTILSGTAIPQSQAAAAGALTNAIAKVNALITAQGTEVDPSLKDAVTALQKHVISHYGSVDDFLDSEDVQVSADFSNLSNDCGYAIDPSNIAD